MVTNYFSNQIKTVIFLGVLTGLLIAGGYFIGGQNGAITALILSAIMNIGSYWFSDKIVLSLYHAQPVSRAESPQLYSIVQNLASEANIPMPRLYKVNLPTPNAFATGRNPKNAVVAVTPSIVELLNKNELKAVIAHEISHITNKDILISGIAATLAGALSYLAQIAYFAGSFGGRNESNHRNPLGLFIFVMLTPLVAGLLHLAISRSREFLADNSGAQLSHDPLALASALEKLHNFSRKHPLAVEPKYEATAHLFIVNPFRNSWLTNLFSTHPRVEERIARLRQLRQNKLTI